MTALIIISCAGVLCMMAEVFRFKRAIVPVMAAAMLLALASLAWQWNRESVSAFSHMYVSDHFSMVFSAVIIATSLLWLMMSGNYFKVESNTAEHSSLLLFAVAGGLLMVGFADLTVFFIGLEILSIALYVLAGSEKKRIRSNEAGLKYFLMGSFATGFLLFGIALIYGATGTFNLNEIASRLSAMQQVPAFVVAGIFLIMVGLCFKVAAVPFHFWAPDVYEGSPVLITTFMATVVKTAAFGAFYRLFNSSFSEFIDTWAFSLAVISAITMLAGNIMAAWQQSLKRMLAYSGIAHAGYMLMAVIALNDSAAPALLLYVVAYSLATTGAFALLYSVSRNGNEQVSALKGLYKSDPWTTAMMVVLLLSLAGIPPVAGFFAKYYLFTAALDSSYLWLVLIAVISSLIGVYYYFRILYTMFQQGSPVDTMMPAPKTVILVTAILTLAVGLFPYLIHSLL